MSSSSENQKPIPLLTDPVEIRWFIKYHVRRQMPVFEGYKELCTIIPEFDYPEYDFWFYRFVAGNLDVNYDRSADPEPWKLQELPEDVLSKILEKVDLEQRFKIRKLSKIMMCVVDQLKTAYDKIVITCDKFSVSSVGVFVEVGNSSWGNYYFELESEGLHVLRNKQREHIVGGSLMEIVFHDLGVILRPTKIRLENFDISAQDFEGSKRFEVIVDFLVSISKKAKFHVKSAKIEVPEFNLALSVLSVMEPGVLEKLKIGISSEDEPKLIDMNQIKDMEQFERAKTVSLTEFGIIQSTDLASFLGYESFDVHVKSMEPEDVICLRDDLSKQDKAIFKACSIKLQIPLTNIDEIARVFGEEVSKNRIRVESSIANSEKVLKFVIQGDRIDIRKTDPTPISDNSNSDDSDSDD